jgi:hypothetical protein
MLSPSVRGLEMKPARARSCDAEKHEPHFDASLDAIMLALDGVGYDEQMHACKCDTLTWMLLAGLPPDPVSRKRKVWRGRPPKKLSMRCILIECVVDVVREKMRAGMSRDAAIDSVAHIMMEKSRDPSTRLTRQQIADAFRRGINLAVFAFANSSRRATGHALV